MNEINFTFSRTNFINEQSYNERTHAEAWEYGLPNFATEGLELDEVAKTISGGRGINRGIPFALGVSGETQPLELTYNYIYVKSMLNGYASITTIVESDDEHVNTSTVKWFKIYDRLNGDDLRHSSYVKEVFFESAGEDQFVFNINGKKTPPFNVSVLQSSWSKSDADNRFERQLSINNEYTNTELIGMNMAMIINDARIKLEGSRASVIVGHGSQAEFSALKTAALELINEIYGETLGDGTALNTINLRLETSYKGGLSGNQILSIGTNGGDVYYFQYDNWGTNYTTVNKDVFRAVHMSIGRLITDGMFIRSSDNFFIRGTMATQTVTNAIDIFNIDYSNGTNFFNISRNASDTLTGRQLRFYLRDRAGGVIQQGLEVNGGDTAGVVHRAVGVNKRLAYASEVASSLELQRASLLIDIDLLESEEEATPTKATKIAKALDVKAALLKNVELELKTLEDNMEEAASYGEHIPDPKNESEE